LTKRARNLNPDRLYGLTVVAPEYRKELEKRRAKYGVSAGQLPPKKKH
jgi:hypothetical protein